MDIQIVFSLYYYRQYHYEHTFTQSLGFKVNTFVGQMLRDGIGS